MNILPFILMLLLLFSLASHSLVDQYLYIKKVEKNITFVEKHQRIKQNKKILKKENNDHPKDWKKQRLNLYPLFTEDPKNHKDLYILFKKLLHILYGDASEIDTIAEGLILQKKMDLTTIKFEDPKLQLFYYRMLKGTKKNDKKEMIPPLIRYISTKNSANKKICFLCASKPILLLFFDESEASKIKSMNRKERASYFQYIHPSIASYFTNVH